MATHLLTKKDMKVSFTISSNSPWVQIKGAKEGRTVYNESKSIRLARKDWTAYINEGFKQS